MNNNTTSGGIGFVGLLQVALIVLKIVGYLPAVSWLWILTAWFWIPFVILIVALVVIGSVLGVAVILDAITARSKT